MVKTSATVFTSEGWGLMPTHKVLNAAPVQLQLMWKSPAFKPVKGARATLTASIAVDDADNFAVNSGMVLTSSSHHQAADSTH